MFRRCLSIMKSCDMGKEWDIKQLNLISKKSYEIIKTREDFNCQLCILLQLCNKISCINNSTTYELSTHLQSQIDSTYILSDRDSNDRVSCLIRKIRREVNNSSPEFLLSITACNVYDSLIGSKFNKKYF
jgi:hypothetical protein